MTDDAVIFVIASRRAGSDDVQVTGHKGAHNDHLLAASKIFDTVGDQLLRGTEVQADGTSLTVRSHDIDIPADAEILTVTFEEGWPKLRIQGAPPTPTTAWIAAAFCAQTVRHNFANVFMARDQAIAFEMQEQEKLRQKIINNGGMR